MARLISLAATAALLVAACGSPSTPASTPAAGSPAASAAPASSPAAGAATPVHPTIAPALPSPAASATSGAVPRFALLPTASLDKARAAALQAILDRAVHNGAPDAYAAVITEDGSWSGAAGIGGPDGRQATAVDEFALASLTRVFTTALILRLAEEGRIDLDAPLASYVGDLEVDSNGATVRQALQMRSGLPDYAQPDAREAIQADARHVWSVNELVSHFAEPEAAPGSRWIHANPNFVLLAVAAEQVTGSSFADALRTEVLDPVGASRIVQQGKGTSTPKPWALPTAANGAPIAPADYGADGVISFMSSVSFSFGSGSMAGDAPSVAAWAWHLMAGDILSRASLQSMLPGGDGHGIGLERLSDLGNRDVVGLTGEKTGYGSMLAVVPAEQVVVVFFVNDPGFIFESYVRDLMSASKAG